MRLSLFSFGEGNEGGTKPLVSSIRICNCEPVSLLLSVVLADGTDDDLSAVLLCV